MNVGGRITIVVAVVVVVAGGVYAVTRFVGGKADPTTAVELPKATVVSTDGATVDGAKIDGGLHIKANNVRVVNTTVHAKGESAIHIFDGVRGTAIENSEVFCDAPRTDGIVYGNYTASRVKVHGCRVGFQHSAGAPALVTESTWNDKPYAVNFAFSEPGKKHANGRPGLVAGPVTAPVSGAKPWPGPANTGVPRDAKLTPYTGKLDITAANTVIEAKEINGCLGIKAKNVTIKRSKISCKIEGMIVRVYDDLPNGASVTIEDSEIDGQGDGLGIGFGNFTLRRVNMHNLNEGVRVSDNAVVEDCWIHDLVFTDQKDHQDILQTTGGKDMVVRHNTLESFNPAANDPFNAAFMLGSETAPSVTNLLVEDNLFSGGNYTVNFRPDMRATNVRFRNNVFVRNMRYGPVVREDLPGVTWEPNNIWIDNGKPVHLPEKA